MCLLAANCTASRTSSADVTATTAAGVESSNRALKTLFAVAKSGLDGRIPRPDTASANAVQSCGPVGDGAGSAIAPGVGGCAWVDRQAPSTAPAATVLSVPRRKA